MMRTEEMGSYTLAKVWPVWWEQKQQEIGPKTAKCYGEYKKPLLAFFGAMKLEEIHIADIVAYRSSRVTAGPGLINHEINCLSQILGAVGLWEPIAKLYKQLKVPKSGPGIALLPEEEQYLFTLAMNGSQRWKVAYCTSLITNHTTAGPGELRNLRLKDVDLRNRVLHIREGTKNEFRVRDIPLSDEAFWAVSELHTRAVKLGAIDPDHYLLPGRAPRQGDSPAVTKPVLGWRTAWYALRKEVAKKYPRLAKLRVYDLRHNTITKLLENPNISEEVIENLAGHSVSSRMKKRYSHIRMDAKRKAVRAISNDGISRTPVTPATPPAPVGSVQWTASTLFGLGAPIPIAKPIATAVHRKLRLVKG
ncbi:MAG TPA: tyrosine-type recombinase/integrase [Terriglobales bacterium]|nr:tyrosine-type recombinase/integrase [Terriglobales bacterium]